jgi:DNA-binding NarL/FixJ family response regulator
MRSRYWSFVEACDAASSPRIVRDLLARAYRDAGVGTFLIATHAPLEHLRSLGVVQHNWPAKAWEYLLDSGEGGNANPLFAAIERSAGPLDWAGITKRQQKPWFDRLRDLLGGGVALSQSLRSRIVSASCSITLSERPEPERLRLYMRMANYAYQSILELQAPALAASEQLTAREHEFLYRAAILGEKPSSVASHLGVKVTTVRTLRQKANVRLDADSQEQLAWRMLETGQLFRQGRKGRPRSR